MTDTSKNVAIGVLVTIALGLVLWVLLFLHPSFGDGKFQLHVRFTNIEKINVGTRVTYAGRPVGEVIAIDQVPEETRAAGSDANAIYIYDLTLAIDSQVPIYSSDEITVGTAGLMGERFISILPKRPKNQKATRLAYDAVVYATRALGAEDAFAQVSRVATKAEETMESVAKLVQENREQFDATLKSLQGASSQLNTLLSTANNLKLVESLAKASLQIERTMDQTNTIVSKVANGDGTVGKLLTSNDFYQQTSELMNKMNTLMNDINNYGVMFHLDKSWQRERKRRLQELAERHSKAPALDTAK